MNENVTCFIQNILLLTAVTFQGQYVALPGNIVKCVYN